MDTCLCLLREEACDRLTGLLSESRMTRLAGVFKSANLSPSISQNSRVSRINFRSPSNSLRRALRRNLLRSASPHSWASPDDFPIDSNLPMKYQKIFFKLNMFLKINDIFAILHTDKFIE